MKMLFRGTMILIWGCVAISGMLASCSDLVQPVSFSQEEVVRLLSGDSVKSWVRIDLKGNPGQDDLSECDLNRITTYVQKKDTLTYTLAHDPAYCSGDTSVTAAGEWEVYSGTGIQDRVDHLRFISDGDTTITSIVEITSLHLILSFTIDESLVEESYAFFPEE